MEKYTELHLRLTEAQNRLVVPKDNYNSFGGFKYRSAEDIMKAVKPILSTLGLTLVLSDQLVAIGDHEYVESTATLWYEAVSTSATAYARHPNDKKGMDDAQLSGLTSSYARKYALCALFLIDDGVDNDHAMKGDGDKYKKPVARKPKPPRKSVKALAWENMKKYAQAHGLDPKELADEVKSRQDFADNEAYWTAVSVEFGE